MLNAYKNYYLIFSHTNSKEPFYVIYYLPEFWMNTNHDAISQALERIFFVCAGFTSITWSFTWGLTIMWVEITRGGLLIYPLWNVGTNSLVRGSRSIWANKIFEYLLIFLSSTAGVHLKKFIWLVITGIRRTAEGLCKGFIIKSKHSNKLSIQYLPNENHLQCR